MTLNFNAKESTLAQMGSNSGPETRHPDYDRYLQRWQRMYDVLEGEERIKQREGGKRYLPVPGHLSDLMIRGDEEKKKWAADEWKYHVRRAQFPTWVRDAVRSMSGLVRKLDSELELPKSIEFLREKATGDGFSVEQLFARVVAEAVSYGRCALWVDIDEEGKPYLALYDAFSLINWKEHKGRDGNELKLAVLMEQREAGDEFSHDSDTVFRVASIDSETKACTVRTYAQGDMEPSVEEDMSAFGGKPIDFVPIVVIGSRDNAPDVDDIPLEGMALASLKYYEVSADYYKSLHMTSHPQPYATGLDDETTVSVSGPGALWMLPDNATVGYLETQGVGIERQFADMQMQKTAAMEIGAKSMDANGVESGDARKARQDDQRATLATIVATASAGIEKALRYCAVMYGQNPDEVKYTVKPDFNAHDIDPQMATQLFNASIANLISKEAYWQYITTGKLPDRDYQEESAFIENTGNPNDVYQE